MGAKKYRWWHGLFFYAGVQAARFVLKAAAQKHVSRDEDREFYKTERLPVFAPPPIAFPIAWTINSIAAIAGGMHVLNLPAETEGRDDFLRLQSAAWGLFAAFDAAYFGLRSPINAALVTYAYTGVTLASLDVARRRMHDSSATVSLLPILAWLALANPVGTLQATWNRDSFWNIGPLLEPKPEWVKNNLTERSPN